MAANAGSIAGKAQVIRNYTGLGALNVAQVNINLPAQLIGDTYTVAGVGAAIQAATKNGKTVTIVGCMDAGAGQNSAGTAVYAGAITVSGDGIAGQQGSAPCGATAIALPGGTTTPIQILVAYTEA